MSSRLHLWPKTESPGHLLNSFTANVFSCMSKLVGSHRIPQLFPGRVSSWLAPNTYPELSSLGPWLAALPTSSYDPVQPISTTLAMLPFCLFSLLSWNLGLPTLYSPPASVPGMLTWNSPRCLCLCLFSSF